MIIIQISDLHLGSSDLKHDKNAQRLEQVIEWIRQFRPRPDLLIATGDLSDDGTASSYEKLAHAFDSLDLPLILALGNHDCRGTFCNAFSQALSPPGFVQYSRVSEGRKIVILDTLDEGRDAGLLCEERLQWLEAELAADPELPTLIVLHHPPIRAGIAWMDPDRGQSWIQRLKAIVLANPQIVALLAGHLHLSMTANFGGRPLIVAQSTAEGLALDLRPMNPSQPDQRAMIVDTPPGLVVHCWDEDFVSHHLDIEQMDVVIRFDERFQPTVERLMRE